ncbi:MAG: hypothetical protein SGI92_14205 [Bryobacteraceae bacterium]|nr:hypothetical protein [Bryobacteraceae bacterium]
MNLRRLKDVLLEEGASFIQRLHWRVRDRAPSEYEMSYFLEQLLLRGQSKEELARFVLSHLPTPAVAAQRAPEPIDADMTACHAGALLAWDGSDFAVNLWRCILKREPSPEELARALDVTASGSLGKFRLMLQTAQSADARATVAGLDAVPVAPSVGTAGELLKLEGEAFVLALYGGVLGREPSAAEMRSAYSETRIDFLLRLSEQSGARQLPGLDGLRASRAKQSGLGGWLESLRSIPRMAREIEALHWRCSAAEHRALHMELLAAHLQSRLAETEDELLRLEARSERLALGPQRGGDT